ncbi:DUF3806 domain-containing protein [Sanguibacter suaedae]|uniref:DUF3806 domain-containing protein n=1 Tax=Sanguibacter suaedae TaxID=2795737 RepID=A0A934MC48_9MICO|nr:DUF3806 domain-containing protein [Sanguibacter suaedae]MBI9116021.1 DUF3806 domain-containing protein [Sanguibacter suaedae]
MKLSARATLTGRIDTAAVRERTAIAEEGHVDLRTPSPVELVWMEELRVHLRAPGVDLTSVAAVSDLFDEYCAAWHAAPEGERWNPNYVITALGVALGDTLLARSPGAHWQVAVDARITTVAVRNDLCHSTVFPVDAVARRWISCELGWMDRFVEETTTSLHLSLARDVPGRG